MSIVTGLITFTAGLFIQKKRTDNLFEIILGAFLFHYIIIVNSYYLSELIFKSIKLYYVLPFMFIFSFIIIFINRRTRMKPLIPEIPDIQVLPAVLIIIGLLVFISINVYGCFLPVISEDDLQYHALMFAEWTRAGHLAYSKIFYGSTHGPYAPAVVELYNYHMFPNQAILLFMSFLSVAAILLRLNSGKNIICVLALATFIFYQKAYLLKQSITVGGDLGLLLFFSLGLLFYLTEDFFLFAVSIGFLLGVKQVAIPYALVLVFLFLWSSKKRGLHSLLLICAFIITSGFWYIRNWIYTGNPVFPVTIDLFGIRIFDGIMTSHTVLEPIADIIKSINIWAGPELLLFIVSVYLLYRKKLINKKLIPVLFIPFISILIFFKIPVHSLNEHRFLFPALVALDAVIMYTALNYKYLLYAIFAVQFIVVVPQWYNGITWYTGKIISAKEEDFLVKRYGDEAKGWLFVSQNCKKTATTGNNLNYHLFAKNYINDVRYINPTIYEGTYLHEISKDARNNYHVEADYPDPFYRDHFSIQKWVERINNFGPDCIYLAKTPLVSLSGTQTEKTIEETWLEQTLKKYEPVFSNSKVTVWATRYRKF